MRLVLILGIITFLAGAAMAEVTALDLVRESVGLWLILASVLLFYGLILIGLALKQLAEVKPSPPPEEPELPTTTRRTRDSYDRSEMLGHCNLRDMRWGMK